MGDSKVKHQCCGRENDRAPQHNTDDRVEASDEGETVGRGGKKLGHYDLIDI